MSIRRPRLPAVVVRAPAPARRGWLRLRLQLGPGPVAACAFLLGVLVGSLLEWFLR